MRVQSGVHMRVGWCVGVVSVCFNLVVGMDEDVAQTGDAKQLSGGERSLTTMAFVLALGQSLQTPFRMMDEFDVYMVRRRISNTQIE